MCYNIANPGFSRIRCLNQVPLCTINKMYRMEDQAFLEYVIKAIVGKPEAVKVERTVDERGVLLTLDVDVSDIGYVIGRQGQTARAVRTLLRIVGAKNNARVNLKINEPEGGRHSANPIAAPVAATAAPATAVEEEIDTSAVDDLNI